MAPLLTVYADVVGILGGLTVGTQVMDFSSLHYFEQLSPPYLASGKFFRIAQESSIRIGHWYGRLL